MEVILYSGFSKRKNSTKQPTGITGVTKEVRLKERCDVLKPSFFISGVGDYTYLKAWNNYYFIDNVAFDINGAQYIECSLDVLATWKLQILETYAFIEYSSSNYDVNVIDDRIAHEVTKATTIEVEETIFTQYHAGGCVCIMTSCVKYGCTPWIVSIDVFKHIVDSLIRAGSSIWQSIEELFGDATGSIIGARYIPIPYSFMEDYIGSQNQDEVALGDWNTGEQGLPFDGCVYSTVTIDIPWRYSDFRRCSQFTSYRLCLPFVGCVELQPENLIGYNALNIEYAVNCATGNISYGIWTRSGIGQTVKLLGTYTAEFGRQIPVATDQINAMGVLGGGLTAGTGAIAGMTKNIAQPLGLGGYGGGMLSAAAILAGIATATIAANKQDFVTVGGFGGGFGETILNAIYLQEVTNDCRTTPDELLDLYGRPCMKVLQISTLTGFVKTVGFAIELETISEVRTMINDAMDSGVYLE